MPIANRYEPEVHHYADFALENGKISSKKIYPRPSFFLLLFNHYSQLLIINPFSCVVFPFYLGGK
jgi:hypothetical protein